MFGIVSSNKFELNQGAIANNAINHAIKLLSDKVILMDNLVDELIDKETLDAQYIISALNSFLSTNNKE